MSATIYNDDVNGQIYATQVYITQFEQGSEINNKHTTFTAPVVHKAEVTHKEEVLHEKAITVEEIVAKMIFVNTNSDTPEGNSNFIS